MPRATRNTNTNSGKDVSAPPNLNTLLKKRALTPSAAANDSTTVAMSINGATTARSSRARMTNTTARTSGMMAFRSCALFDSMTVGENVLFSLELREDYDAQNKEDVVNGLLQMVDIAEAKDTYPTDLSTGYKRAVAIARALAAQPQCILYDEPTTMVDPIMSDHLGDLMVRLKRQLKLTSVVVTHDLDLMYKVADRLVFP